MKVDQEALIIKNCKDIEEANRNKCNSTLRTDYSISLIFLHSHLSFHLFEINERKSIQLKKTETPSSKSKTINVH